LGAKDGLKDVKNLARDSFYAAVEVNFSNKGFIYRYSGHGKKEQGYGGNRFH
jgi:hypothetical protein